MTFLLTSPHLIGVVDVQFPLSRQHVVPEIGDVEVELVAPVFTRQRLVLRHARFVGVTSPVVVVESVVTLNIWRKKG